VAVGTPYFVARVSGAASNPVITVATATAAGDAIFVSANTGSSVTGISDSKGNTYLAVINDTANGVCNFAATYKGSPGTPTAALTTSDTVTVTTGGTGNAVQIAACSGLAAQAANVNTGVDTTGTSNAASKAITPLAVGDLLFSFWCFSGNAVSATWANGFTKIADTAITNNGISQGFLVSTSTSSVTALCNLGASISWYGGVASFAAAVTAGGILPQQAKKRMPAYFTRINTPTRSGGVYSR
jgi:hypothetical protein